MANEIFIDTSGFFALTSVTDEQHELALRRLAAAIKAKRRFVTTDYVIVETANLFKARKLSHHLPKFFCELENSQLCRVIWTDSTQFSLAIKFLLKHNDQSWSFTDCHSFWLMKQLRLREALTKDHHFRQAGFKVLLD
jgi:uncharacterized protein